MSDGYQVEMARVAVPLVRNDAAPVSQMYEVMPTSFERAYTSR